MANTDVVLPEPHVGQLRAAAAWYPSARQIGLNSEFRKAAGGKRKAIRCGRRWGKTDYLKMWLGKGALSGYPCALFAPDYKRMVETYAELAIMLEPATPRVGGANKSEMVIRLKSGGRIDFWTTEDENAGRSRHYKRVGLDESAFAKSNMIKIWERAIEPTLTDLRGDCVTASNTNGIDPENFMWVVCNDPKYRFIEVHEPSWNNPHVPRPQPGWTLEEIQCERDIYYRDLRERTHPLVFAQEFDAEFVDWSGVAFFSLDKWLDERGAAYPYPANCDFVFAVLDTASKTGTANDGTAVVYLARNMYDKRRPPLIILDWDIVQIEGNLLDNWLVSVKTNLDHLAGTCGARMGVRGVWIEDKSSGIILLQQARKRFPQPGFVNAIAGQWMQLGKDERALSTSAYHYQGYAKISEHAHNKTLTYKNTTRNHLNGQVAGFRIGDKDAAKRADDLLDAYVHSLALTFGDNKQF